MTRLSALVLGLGNMLNGQLIKGLLFLAGELAYIFFMIRYGFHNLVMLVTLGSVEQQEIWDEAKFAATCEMAENDIESLLAYVNDRYYGPGQV